MEANNGDILEEETCVCVCMMCVNDDGARGANASVNLIIDSTKESANVRLRAIFLDNILYTASVDLSKLELLQTVVYLVLYLGGVLRRYSFSVDDDVSKSQRSEKKKDGISG